MSTGDPDLQSALDALSDDRPFDWDAAAASADPATQETLAQLRVLASVARACRDGDDTPCRPLPEPPFTWGPLEVLARLGRGASGQVFRARDRRLDRVVALKLLPLEPDAVETTGGAMVREGRLLARIQHPNVVAVHGADVAGGYLGIWMELVDGQPLDRLVAERGPLPLHEILSIGRDLCGALAAVHDQGLIHGDVKAQNVVRTPAGRLVLMDFGASRDARHASSGPLTGTPMYMAPELLAGAPPSVRSDVYAVGVLLHHLLTGAYPVSASSMAELPQAIATRRPLPHGPRTPVALTTAIDRALAADPSQRFSDTRALAAALAAVEPMAMGRRRARTRTVVAAGVVAVTAAAAIGWLAVDRRAGEPAHTAAGVGVPTLRRVASPPLMLVGGPSPDGTWLAVTDGSGNLARQHLDTGRLEPITADASLTNERTRFAEFSRVAPDGRSIAFGWPDADGPYEFRVVALDGSRPRTVWSTPDVRTGAPLDWWPDGGSLLVLLQYADGGTALGRLFTAAAPLLTLVDLKGVLPEHASVSPDGEWVAYDAPQQGANGHRDIRVVRADGRGDTVLIGQPSNDFGPVWTPEGRLLFLSDRSGTVDLWAVTMTGSRLSGLPSLVMRDMGRTRMLGLTNTGTLLHQRLTGAVDVYVAPGAMSEPTPVAETFVGMNLSPRWAPDGKRLAYASRRGLRGTQGGTTVLVVRDLERGTTREWQPAVSGFTVSGWTPDGAGVVLYGFDRAMTLGNHVCDLRTGTLTPLLAGLPDASRAQYTRDGRVLVQDRRAVLLVEPASGRATDLVTYANAGIEGIVGGFAGRGMGLSPDERQLAYSATVLTQGQRTWVLRILDRTTGRTRELVRAMAAETLLFHDWFPDGRSVLVTTRRQQSEVPSLWRIDVHDGSRHALGDTMRGFRDASVAPEGGRLAFTAGVASFDVWALDHVAGR